MKVLLINSNRYWIPVPVIPMGLCSVAAALQQDGHEVSVLDLCFARDPAAAIAATLRRFSPDVVGVGIRNIDNGDSRANLFFLDEIDAEILTPLKRGFSGPIVLGGGAVGINAAEILALAGLDLALRGDGEVSMVDLVRRLATGQSLAGSPGLVRRVGGGFVEEGPPLLVEDLDDLPLVDPSEHIDLRLYRQHGSPVQVQTKRGCRLACAYCTYNLIEGRRYRLKSPERVALEVVRLAERTGMKRIEFVDSTFNIPLDHAKAVLRAIIARGSRVELTTSNLNPGGIDEELVELMCRANFVEFGLGAEAVSDRALRALGKNYGARDVVRAIDLLEGRGIPLSVFLILGGPGETRETFAETLDALEAHLSSWNLICAAVGVRPYRGSPIAREMARARPGCSTDGFLRNVPLEPEGIPLDRVWSSAKHAVLRLPNLLLYGEESDRVPPWLMRLASMAFAVAAPRQPIWRLVVLHNKLANSCGLRRLMLWLLDRKLDLAGLRGGVGRLARAGG
jgi:radical SAM superfamily enzyme YgiQ (UPF0313 family)